MATPRPLLSHNPERWGWPPEPWAGRCLVMSHNEGEGMADRVATVIVAEALVTQVPHARRSRSNADPEPRSCSPAAAIHARSDQVQQLAVIARKRLGFLRLSLALTGCATAGSLLELDGADRRRSSRRRGVRFERDLLAGVRLSGSEAALKVAVWEKAGVLEGRAGRPDAGVPPGGAWCAGPWFQPMNRSRDWQRQAAAMVLWRRMVWSGPR